MAAFHGRRAPFPPPFPAPPVAGSLPTPIKWNPHPSFYRFSPFPSLPVVVSPLPAFPFSLSDAGRPPAASPASPERRPVAPSPPPASPPPPPRRPALRFARRPPEARSRRRPPPSFAPATSSRLPLLARASPGRAVFSLGLAAAPSPSVSPPFRGESTGDASSPASSGVATTSPPPAASATSPERRPTSPPPLPAPECRPLSRPSHGVARISPERRHLRAGLSFLLVGSSPRCTTTFSNIAAARSTPSPPPLSRCCLPSSFPRHRSSSPIDVPSVAQLVVSRRRLRHRHHCGVFHAVLVPVQPLPAVLVASSPVPVVVVVVVLSSFPVVVAFVPPSSRSRPSSAFVKRAAAAPFSSSSSAPRRQASCRPCLAFVQGSPPKSFPRRSSPPRPFVVVVPTPRRVVVRISPLAAPSSSFRCRPCPLCGCRPRYLCIGVGSRSLVRVVTVLECPLGSRVVSTCATRVVSSGVRLSATRLG